MLIFHPAGLVLKVKKQYVPENGLRIETMISSVRFAIKDFLECHKMIPLKLKEPFEKFATAKRTENFIIELDILYELHNSFTNTNRLDFELTENVDDISYIYNLIDVVWDYVFMYYFWIKKTDKKGSKNAADQD